MTIAQASEPTVPLPAARLRELGRIRLGHKVPTDSGKMRPAKLAHWRLTSPTGRLLEQVSELYGGGVEEWTDAPTEHRQWEILTDSDTLNVALVPGQLFSQYHEMWTSAGCRRRCDGRRNLIDDTPCACPPDPEERKRLAAKSKPEACKLVTRMNVILHELEDLGVWRLETSGYYAGGELRGVAELVQGAQSLLPAVLRLEQRTKNEAGKPPIHYAVPVIELLVPTRALIAQQLAAAAGGQVMQIGAQPVGELAAPQESGPVEGKGRPLAGSDHTSGPDSRRGRDPGPDHTPASGLGPPGPLAGSTPDAPAASGGPDPDQVPPDPDPGPVAIASDDDMQQALARLGFHSPDEWKAAATQVSRDPGFAELKGSQIIARARLMAYRGDRAAEALRVLAEQAPPAPESTGDAA
jgi:Recombination directionality factor-like